MLLPLLIAAGATVALTALYVLTTKHQPAEALAGETTLANSADPAGETLTGGPAGAPVERNDWHLITVDALSDAEELLDALENQGVTERELILLGNSCFAVRWR